MGLIVVRRALGRALCRGGMGLRIGFSRVDITPKIGVELCGYGYYLQRQSGAILDPLYVRAVALRDNLRTLLVVNCDLIGLTSTMIDNIKGVWQEKYGLQAEDALLLSIHTHSGPATGVLRGCGEPDADYVDYLTQRIIDAGGEALGHLVEVTGVSSFNGSVDDIAWNRVFDGAGPVDRGVYGLVFHREGLVPLVLVNYACHPVTLGRNDAISADYPGRVVKSMGEAGYEAVFLNGFCGDIDPELNRKSWGSGIEATIDDYGNRIAAASLKAMESAQSFIDLTLDAFQLAVRLPLQPLNEARIREERQAAAEAKEAQPAYARAIEEWVEAMERQAPSGTETAIVQVLRVGQALLIGFPGETFTQLGLTIKEALPGWRVVTLGNANAVMRYIPVAADIREKGYAGYGSCRIYDRLPLQAGAGEYLSKVTIAAIQERFGS